ncbi:MAG: EamA family transporter [Bacteroidales bacterium]|nr:EamA family transporter [Bacteroidales bacterium]MCF8389478.1 EamA family transporter [Bacteroidales bacterium]
MIVFKSFGNVFVARDAKNIPPLVLSSSTMIIGGATLYLFSLPFEGFHPAIKPLEYYASLAWLSFLSATAISIWFTLLKRPEVKVSDLNFWKFLIPVMGAILAFIILPEEKISAVAVAGMSIIAISLIMLNILKRRQLKNPAP